MAAGCREFCEDAFINVHIATEGALQLLRIRLKNNKKECVSYEDAYEYLKASFRMGDALADFLREQHEKWVMAKHPESKWGVFWSPPLQADDFFETYEVLVSIYRHLITGEPGRETAEL